MLRGLRKTFPDILQTGVDLTHCFQDVLLPFVSVRIFSGIVLEKRTEVLQHELQPFHRKRQEQPGRMNDRLSELFEFSRFEFRSVDEVLPGKEQRVLQGLNAVEADAFVVDPPGQATNPDMTDP